MAAESSIVCSQGARVVACCCFSAATLLVFRRVRQQRSMRGQGPAGLDLTLNKVLEASLTSDAFTVLLGDSKLPVNDNVGMIWKVTPKPIISTLPVSERLAQLQKGKWTLVSESGAEFSYWTCEEKGSDGRKYDVEIVSKVNAKLVERYSSKNKPRPLRRETTQDYATKQKTSPDWVANIVEGRKEIDRVLITRPGEYLVCADSKWKDFPAGQPYLLGIAVDRALFTLRELRQEHIPMLLRMKEDCLQVMKERFAVEDVSAVRCFFHYPPQFDWLHVHFCVLNDWRADAAVERAHLLEDVCDRLSENSMFYANATLTVRV